MDVCCGQVMGRWCVQNNIVVVAKTVKKSRMEENMAIFDFALDDADLKTLDNMTSSGWFHCPHCTLHPTPYTLHPTPYTLHPTPYTLHIAPCTLHPTPYTLHPQPWT